LVLHIALLVHQVADDLVGILRMRRVRGHGQAQPPIYALLVELLSCLFDSLALAVSLDARQLHTDHRIDMHVVLHRSSPFRCISQAGQDSPPSRGSTSMKSVWPPYSSSPSGS